jgi:hypothetical protein
MGEWDFDVEEVNVFAFAPVCFLAFTLTQSRMCLRPLFKVLAPDGKTVGTLVVRFSLPDNVKSAAGLELLFEPDDSGPVQGFALVIKSADQNGKACCVQYAAAPAATALLLLLLLLLILLEYCYVCCED